MDSFTKYLLTYSSQQYSISTEGTHEGLRSVESGRVHVMVMLRNITQPCHNVLQIALTMLSHNLKVDYIIEDRPEELQSFVPWSPTCCITVTCDTSSLILLIGAQPSRMYAV